MKKTFYESERDNKNKVIHILLYNTECKMHFHNATEILFVKKFLFKSFDFYDISLYLPS